MLTMPCPSGRETWVVRLSPRGGPEQLIELGPGEDRVITLGSAPKVDVRLQHAGVASVHGSIQRRGAELLLRLEAPQHHLSVNGGPPLTCCVLSDRCTVELGAARVHITAFRSNVITDVIGTGGTEIISREWLYAGVAQPLLDAKTTEYDSRELWGMTDDATETWSGSDEEQLRVQALRRRLPALGVETLPLGTPLERLFGETPARAAGCRTPALAVERRTPAGAGPSSPQPSPEHATPALATQRRTPAGAGSSSPHTTAERGRRSAAHLEAAAHRLSRTPDKVDPKRRDQRAGWGRSRHVLATAERTRRSSSRTHFAWVLRLGVLARERPWTVAPLTLAITALLTLCLLGVDRVAREWF